MLGRSATILLLAGLGQPVAAGTPVVHDGISPPAQAWKAAIEAGDIATLARMHDAATIVYPPNVVEQRGGDAIMKGYAEMLATDTVRVTFEDAHWTEQGPLVVSWGRTTLTVHPKAGGADIVSHSRFTDAAVAVTGGWRYLVDHASVVR